MIEKTVKETRINMLSAQLQLTLNVFHKNMMVFVKRAKKATKNRSYDALEQEQIIGNIFESRVGLIAGGIKHAAT